MVKKVFRREDIAERRAFALQLRKDGHTYEFIGKKLGEHFHNQKGSDEFTPQYASKLIREAIKSVFREKADELIQLELQRLDDLQLEAMSVLRGNHPFISAGMIVRVLVRGANGMPVIDPATQLPKTENVIDDGPRLAAIDRLLKIQERRSKLLGLDKPTKVASTTPDGKAAQSIVIMATPEDQKI